MKGVRWNIRAVSGGVVIFKVVDGAYKALTAVGSSDGSETGTGVTSAGNIILSDYTEGNSAQIWTLTQTTINHHIINRSIENLLSLKQKLDSLDGGIQ